MSVTPIVQFGTSRFLQAHADLFVSEAMQSGDALGPISVIQTSGDKSRSGRLLALADKDGFDVRIRGIEDGQIVDRQTRVSSIARALSLPQDLETVSDIVSVEARIILSNTADAGFRPSDADRQMQFSQEMSYPAKLAWLLFKRFRDNANPIQIMPTELIPKNGSVLRNLVCEISGIYPADFRRWLEADIVWVNSLVDRIVSEPLEPAGAVAEPYALWAIEDQPGLLVPCTHKHVQVVSDLEQVETLKLHILNLGHTYLVSRWLKEGTSEFEFVLDMLGNPGIAADLEDLYAREVVPGFQAHGREDDAKVYVGTTLDRFRNPFLDHKLSDIAQNHSEKVERRIATFLSWSRRANPELSAPRLEAIVRAVTG